MNAIIGRRGLLRAGALGAAGLGLAGLFPAWARSFSPGIGPDMPTLSGEELVLKVGHSRFSVGGRAGHAITLNGVLPAPLIRLREGQKFRMTVLNELDEDTSIHWHGLIVPFHMDGVPGISFPGIPARGSFTYEFPIVQSGTYWYHSHSGLQEQMGHYGPMVIDPEGADPIASDREHVIVLSDWSFLHPHRIFSRLKQQGGFFNRQRETLFGQRSPELGAEERRMFAAMRMDPSDIADVNAAAYSFLVNGHGPEENWTGLFRGGERVRLRIVNAAAQTIFNFRIPGLAMTVVAADGQNVRPVTVDEFQIGNAETYDVIVEPAGDRAYTIVAETIDRSGMARATLAPRAGMTAPVPPLRPRPTLGMKDMGMGGGGHGGHGGGAVADPHAGHGAGAHGAGHHAPAPAPPLATAHAGMDHDMRDASKVAFPVGPGVDMISPNPVDRIGDRGLGLEDAEHRVLTYTDLVRLAPPADRRTPTREIEVHLTGNMERFMWSIDGKKLSENPEPLRFTLGEQVRVSLVNDTMMTHPMHVHGHFFELVNGAEAQPLKHTVMVLPGGIARFDMTADAPGDWAFHCHLLYHMHAGMMRVIQVRPMTGEPA